MRKLYLRLRREASADRACPAPAAVRRCARDSIRHVPAWSHCPLLRRGLRLTRLRASAQAQRAVHHGGRSEQRPRHLRPPRGQDAEHRSARRARRAFRPRLHPVSAVQPEPRLAADGPAAGHDARPRSGDRLPHDHPGRRDAAADVQAQRLRRRRASARSTTTAIPARSAPSGLDDPASWDVFVNPQGIDKDEETKVTNYTPARGLGSALAYYASPAAGRGAHRRQGGGRDDRAPGEAQGPPVLHRRRLLPAALPVHRAEEVLRSVSAGADSRSGGVS